MKKVALVAASAVVWSGAALAEGPNWTYIDAGFWQGSEIGDGDNDLLSLEGSIEVFDNYHIAVEYVDGSAAVPGTGDDDTDIDGWEVTVGGHPAMTDNTDFVFEAFYFDLSADDFDDGTGNVNGPDTDGFGTRIGLRSMYTDQVELHGNIEWRDGDIDDVGDSNDLTQLAVNVGGQYFFTNVEQLSANIEASISDDTSARFGLRWNF